MAVKRKDSKGRNLRDNEFQRTDGRYEYRYRDWGGELHSFYSWRLTESDPLPAGRRPCTALREQEKKIAKDVTDGIAASVKATLNDRWDEYISGKPELKSSTRTNYRYLYDKFVRNRLGKNYISAINHSMVKKFFNSLLYEDELKPSSVKIIYAMIRPVFTTAVMDNLIRTNPADRVLAELRKSGSWEQERRSALTEEQQKSFMSFVRRSEQFGHWYPLFVCLLGTGCRIGEMLGLCWSDIDWKNNTISINHNLLYRMQDDGKMAFRVTSPKTKSGIREIPMFQNVRDALLSVKRQPQSRIVVDGFEGFIWRSQNGGLLEPRCVNRAIDRIVDAYNRQNDILPLPHFSVHQLRHTFCTRLCENETDLKLIQEVMGHANISTTMDIYNESNMARKQASFERLETLNDIF